MEELVLGKSQDFTTGYRSERIARKAKGECEHRGYPILVDLEGGGRRALCLGCGAVGPIRKDIQEARKALLEMRARKVLLTFRSRIAQEEEEE
jgi:hypothetical protein